MKFIDSRDTHLVIVKNGWLSLSDWVTKTHHHYWPIANLLPSVQHISSLFRLWLSRLVRVLLGKTVTGHLNKLLANLVWQSLTSGCSHVTQLCISSVLDQGVKDSLVRCTVTHLWDKSHWEVNQWTWSGVSLVKLVNWWEWLSVIVFNTMVWYGWGWVGSFLLPYRSTVLYLIVTFQFLCVILVLQLRPSNHGTMYQP